MAVCQPTAGFVIQCKTCHVILGDSCWFVLASTDPSYICLDAVTPLVQVSDLAEVWTEKQSFFKVLKCRGCASVVGRLYTSTGSEMDRFRDLYCIDPDQVKTYVLGACTGQGDVSGIDSEDCSRRYDTNVATAVLQLRTCYEQLGLCCEQLVHRVKALEDGMKEVRKGKKEELEKP